MSDLTITEFITARLDEMEEEARRMAGSVWPAVVAVTLDDHEDVNISSVAVSEWSPKGFTRVWETGEPDHGWRYSEHAVEVWSPEVASRTFAHVAALRKIVEFQKNWPILVEQQVRPTYLDDFDPLDINSVTLRVHRSLNWLTEQEYIKRFGAQPPTAPHIAAIAAIWADHPDYNEDW